MTVPLLGPMTLSGFAHKWFLLFLLVVLGLVGLYIVVQLARQKRMLRFANMELLESVAPKRPTRWRHLPAILLVAPLLLLTIAMAGPTHDARIPRNRAVVMLVIDVCSRCGLHLHRRPGGQRDRLYLPRSQRIDRRRGHSAGRSHPRLDVVTASSNV